MRRWQSTRPPSVGKLGAEKHDGSYSGMISMRNALTKSKNLVSIRILMAISPQYAQEYITKLV